MSDRKYGEPVWGTITKAEPVAETIYGKVKGINRGGIGIFKGIPYGGPVDKEKRFLPADKPSAWEGILDGTKNGCYAMQNGVSIGADPGPLAAYYKGKDVNSTGELERQGENCLVLDVLTPGLDEKKRPVVFYIHGGGFMTGSGTMAAAADEWCREEDVVVVGVNHRLNIFGYLYLGRYSDKYASSGCAGMTDLVLALQWVKENIAFFGGNPDNVTIMGESGGGAKVTNLMVMESAAGLFHKAIVESGSMPVGRYSIETAEKITKLMLDNLGIEERDWERLLTLPAEDLLNAMKCDIGPFGFHPVADGINVPMLADSGKTYETADYSADVPLMVGASDDEVALFSPFDPSITYENLAEKLYESERRGPAAGDAMSMEEAEALAAKYMAENVKHDSPFHLFMKILTKTSSMGKGAVEHALERASDPNVKAPVYHYVNAYDSAHPADPRYAYAFHTCDLPLQMRIVQRDQDDWISRIMAGAWAAFARTGSPANGYFNWPAFTPQKQETMIFDNNGMSRIE